MKHPRYFPKMALIPLSLTIGVTVSNGNLDRGFAQTAPASPATVLCTETQIETSINRLGEGDTAAFDFLVTCNSQAVPALIKLLKHQDENIRIVAIAILGEIGEGATEAIPFLEEVLRDRREENSDSRIVVVDALGKMGQTAVPALIVALRDEEGSVRYSAASALRQIGKPAVLALIVALKDRDSGVRSNAAWVLGTIGEGAKDAVPALIAALKDQNWRVRYHAASALGRIGKEAKDAVPQLTIAVKNDECSETRRAAITSLRQIAPDEVASFPANIAEGGLGCAPSVARQPAKAPRVAENINRYKRTNPPVMCRYPVVKAILLWKCLETEDNPPPSESRDSDSPPSRDSNQSK